MPETLPGWLPSRFRVMAGQVESIGMYGAACVSCGGLAALLSYAAHASPMVWFSAGFALPIGPMYLHFASDRIMEKRLARWKRWKEDGLIGIGQHDQLRRDALAWYKARHGFGRLEPIEPGEPVSAPPPVPIEPPRPA
jgi:hypothetical protein